MGIEVTRDEDGTEYTGRAPDYPEPDPEPLCWQHHSNICGCEETDRTQQNINPETGEPYPYSTEPPFPLGGPHPIHDIGPEPRFW